MRTVLRPFQQQKTGSHLHPGKMVRAGEGSPARFFFVSSAPPWVGNQDRHGSSSLYARPGPLPRLKAGWPASLQLRPLATAAGLRLRPQDFCMWATRAPSGRHGSGRGRPAALWSCAWKIWTPNAARASTPRLHSKTCAGWAFAGSRGRIVAVRTGPTRRASGGRSIWPRGVSCSSAVIFFPAVARARIWQRRRERPTKAPL